MLWVQWCSGHGGALGAMMRIPQQDPGGADPSRSPELLWCAVGGCPSKPFPAPVGLDSEPPAAMGHNQDQAHSDMTLLTPSPLDAPVAPSPHSSLLGPFIEFFSPPQTHLLPPPPPGSRGSWQPARTAHPVPKRGTAALWQRRWRFGMRRREPAADGALAAALLRD